MCTDLLIYSHDFLEGGFSRVRSKIWYTHVGILKLIYDVESIFKIRLMNILTQCIFL